MPDWNEIMIRKNCTLTYPPGGCNKYKKKNNDYNGYSDSDLDWELFSELVTSWHSWPLLTYCETWSMTLRSRDLQSDSDLDSIRNSCDVFFFFLMPNMYAKNFWSIGWFIENMSIPILTNHLCMHQLMFYPQKRHTRKERKKILSTYLLLSSGNRIT